MPLNLIVSNKASVLNKKIIDFFQLNLMSLNKAALIFDFEIAYPENIDEYTNKGIKNYPVLIHDKTSITGVEKIIKYLKMQVSKYNKRILNKSDTARVDDFWKQTLGNVTVDESGNIPPDDDDDIDDIQQKISQAFQNRHKLSEAGSGSQKTSVNNQSLSSDNPSPTRISMSGDVSPAETIKGMCKSTMDDELMAKFFENQEESL